MPQTAKKSAKKATKSNTVAAKAPANKAKATTKASTSTAKKTAATSSVTVHHTSEPSAWKKTASSTGKSVVTGVRKPKFWAWVGGIIIVVFLLLVGWWQWQRSYVAVVGGQYLPVSMMDDQLRANYGSSGVDSIIQQQLILQEAKKQKIVISDKQIDEQMNKIITNSGGQKSYEEQLRQLGISESLLRTQVEVQLMRETLLKDKIQVTDQEVTDYYNQNKDSIDPDGKIGQEGLSDQIRETLKQQKLDSASPDYIDSLRQQAKVQTHLDHLSLTFGQFLHDSVLTIPNNIYNFVVVKK